MCKYPIKIDPGGGRPSFFSDANISRFLRDDVTAIDIQLWGVAVICLFKYIAAHKFDRPHSVQAGVDYSGMRIDARKGINVKYKNPSI